MVDKKKRKKVLIIVRGASPYHFKNRFFEKIKRYLMRKLASESGILAEGYGQMINFFKKDYKTIETLKWHGNIWEHPDIKPPIEELDKIVKRYRKFQIDIIAVSIGGAITEKVLSKNKKIKVNKLIYLGAVHQKSKHNFSNVAQTINIYSMKDKFFFLVNNIYHGIGGAIISGKNVFNIVLNGIAHDKWCRNIALNEKFLKHKHLYDLYRDLLLSE